MFHMRTKYQAHTVNDSATSFITVFMGHAITGSLVINWNYTIADISVYDLEVHSYTGSVQMHVCVCVLTICVCVFYVYL